MSELGVFLGGEGRNELGTYAGHPTYQSGTETGVIETLLRRIQATGWRVVGAKKWCQIRKFRASGPTPNERRNVQALLLDAKEADAQVLAFVRDSDGDEQRAHHIAQAIEAHEAASSSLDVIGGAAVPALEAWLLSMQGEPGIENRSKAAAQQRFFEKNGSIKETLTAVDIARAAGLSRIPQDAFSLNAWLSTAQKVFAARIAISSP